MTTFNNWRRQPFTGATYQVTRTEVHTIEFFDDWNSYGIQLSEGIYLENPSSVSIVENVSGGAVFAEVSRTTPPIAGQFRVDYEADTFTGTSRIEFNAADNGTEVEVTYKGLGLLASTDNYNDFLENKTVPGDFGVGDDFTVGGDISVSGTALITGDQTNQANINLAGNLNIQGEIQDPSSADTVPINSTVDMNSKKITNLGTPTNSADATTKTYVDTEIDTNIANALQNASVGEVGTYAMLVNVPPNLYNLNPGDTVAGSDMRYANVGGSSSASAPSGTWRCMGITVNSGGVGSTSLFLRIS